MTPTPEPARRSRRVPVTFGVVGALTLGISVALMTSQTATPPAEAGELRAFRECPELRRHMRDLVLPLVTPWGLGTSGFGGAAGNAALAREGAIAGTARAAAPQSDATGGAVGSGPTGTNLQERDVDEPDLAKTDGRLVVTVIQDALHVVDASSAAPRRRGVLPLRDQSASELLLLDGRALVVGHRTVPGPERMSRSGRSGSTVPDIAISDMPLPDVRQRTVLTLVDLSDPDRPAVLGTQEIDGSYLSARLHEGVVRVVLSSQPRLRLTTPAGAGRASERRALAANRAAVSDATEQEWLPQRVIRDASGRITTEGPLLDCSQVRYPVKPSGAGMLSVLTLDLTSGRGLGRGEATSIVADGDLVYASSDRLYIATTVGGWARPMPAIVGGNVAMEAVPERSRTTTKVHAFDLTDRRRAAYVASGTVDGYLLGRWAMSEHENRLRVATTTGPPWMTVERSESSVVVLEERGRQLVRVGSVGGLGKGERVRAVRWFGDLAAVVTFRQTDPLYLVDLSRPARPAVRGELKVPGFSAYLHPLGGGLLLGAGQDADLEGRLKGVQLSVFDVSQLSRPRRVDALYLGAGTSPVEQDSRAFTYLPPRRLAVLPMWRMPNDPVFEKSSIVNSVAVGVTVAEDGTLRQTGWHGTPGAEVLRVLPVGDRLAAVTSTEVSLLDPDGLRTLGTVRLPAAPSR